MILALFFFFATIRAEVLERIDALIPKDYFQTTEKIAAQLDCYSDEEVDLLMKDFEVIFAKTFEKAVATGEFVVTAGGPGSGKSTLLEKWLQTHPGYVYIDPDRTCLPNCQVYKDTCETLGMEEAYNKWRYGSTFIAWVCEAYAFKHHYGLAFGSTLTSPQAKDLLEYASLHYNQVRLLYVSAPLDIREESVRARSVVQVSKDDFINKGNAFYDRLKDYLSVPLVLEFYLRKSFTQTERVAVLEGKQLHIEDEEGWKALQGLHDAVKGNGSFSQIISAR